MQLLDVLVFIGYLACLFGIAWSTRSKKETTEDYYLAGKSIPAWAAACSFIATALSAATFIALPQKGYGSNFTYLAGNLAGLLGMGIALAYFIPRYLSSEITTVYQYLGNKWGKNASCAAGCTFLLGRTLASGARLYIAGIALAFVLSQFITVHSPWLLQACSMFGISIIALITVSFGGIRTVIWTDVCQCAIFVIAALSCILGLYFIIDVPASTILSELSSAEKLTLIKPALTDFNLTDNWNIYAIIIGWTLFNFSAYATDQDLTQRLLTCGDAKAAAKSGIMAILGAIPITMLFVFIGSLLWLYYQNLGTEPEVGSKDIFLNFALHHLPAGLAGLIVAGLCAAAISSMTSELNAMSASAVKDVFLRFKPDSDETSQLRAARTAVILAAIALCGFACFSIAINAWFVSRNYNIDLIDYALAVMFFAYAGLSGCFICARFTRRGAGWSCIAALIIGIASFAWMFLGAVHGKYYALPWQLLLASILSFLICCLGKTQAEHAT